MGYLNVLRGASHHARQSLRYVYAYSSYALNHRSVGSCVVRVIPGGVDFDAARRVAVFVHFDRQGVVHDFVYHYLQSLSDTGFCILFVSNSQNLRACDIDRLTPMCGRILIRKNRGLDFGAYRDAIAHIPDVAGLDALLLANDSVYGPIYRLDDLLARMDSSKADVWGATDSWEFSFHLQSYFILFYGPALRSDAFRRFWDRVRLVRSKTWVIRKYEVGLTRSLQHAGFRCRAVYPYREITRRVVDAVLEQRVLENDRIDMIRKQFIANSFNLINAGTPVNGSHFFWDQLILGMSFPFLKRELLQKNPVNVPFLSYWEDIIREASDYDTDLILRHLELSLKNRSV